MPAKLSVSNDLVREIQLHLITPDPNQPRRIFDKAAIDELAADIKRRGLIQPITVRPGIKSGTYIIKSGERRFRAHQAAKLKTIRALVDDRKQTELERAADQIAENDPRLRKDLNPIELAELFAKLQKEGKSVNDIVDMYSTIGTPMSRPAISNIMRLNGLQDWAKKLISEGKLTASHGKHLLSAPANLQADLRTRIESALKERETVTVDELSQTVQSLTGRQKQERPREASKKKIARKAATSTKPAATPAATEPLFALEPPPPPPASTTQASESQPELPQLPPGMSFRLLAAFLHNAAKVQITLSSQGAGDFQAVVVSTLRKLPDRASAQLKALWNEMAAPVVLRGALDTMDSDLAQHLQQLLAKRAAIKDGGQPADASAENVLTGDGSGTALPPFDGTVEREAPATTEQPTVEA